MKKQYLFITILLILTFSVLNQFVYAQNCPKGKVWVCGCHLNNQSFCSCVDEDKVTIWKEKHQCRYPQIVVQEEYMPISIDDVSNEISNYTNAPHLIWEISQSLAPINKIKQGEIKIAEEYRGCYC